MSLTIGTGPFGSNPSGVFNFKLDAPEHILYFDDVAKRVRVVFNGETIADSTHAKILHESGHTPVYYFPLDDVRRDLLRGSRRHTRCPAKGQASYFSIEVGDRTAEDAVWTYPDPNDDAHWLAGYVAFYWDRVDAWFEEDEEVHVHPRDPYSRIDILDSSRRVRISLEGVVLADSNWPRILFETGLPPRYYLPREDVRTDLLLPSNQHTRCPYKGTASYHSVRVGDDPGARVEEDLVWYYPDPFPEAERIAGRLAFYDERVDVEVGGVAQERPTTPFSR